MTHRFWIAVLLLAMVVSNGAWVYLVLDRAVSLDYARQEQKYLKESLALLKRISIDLLAMKSAGGPSRAEALLWFQEKYRGHVVKEEDGVLFIDEIGLRFADGKLAEIVFLNEID